MIGAAYAQCSAPYHPAQNFFNCQAGRTVDANVHHTGDGGRKEPSDGSRQEPALLSGGQEMRHKDGLSIEEFGHIDNGCEPIG